MKKGLGNRMSDVVDIKKLTPVEKKGNFWLKREDLFEVYGMHGGKARAAYQLIQQRLEEGYTTIVSAGQRESPQCEIISFICENLGIDCILYMNEGAETEVLAHIKNNPHTEVRRVGYPSFTNVLDSKARVCAADNHFGYIPFGMECEENVEITCHQVQNIPSECKRIIMPAGRGMSMSSVICGMDRYGINKPIVGVRVGKDPKKILETYAEGLSVVDWDIIQAPQKYSQWVDAYVEDVQLDPIYEAKCRQFMQDGDLLWIVGKRLM